jgi:hypothetical protein
MMTTPVRPHAPVSASPAFEPTCFVQRTPVNITDKTTLIRMKTKASLLLVALCIGLVDSSAQAEEAAASSPPLRATCSP